MLWPPLQATAADLLGRCGKAGRHHTHLVSPSSGAVQTVVKQLAGCPVPAGREHTAHGQKRGVQHMMRDVVTENTWHHLVDANDSVKQFVVDVFIAVKIAPTVIRRGKDLDVAVGEEVEALLGQLAQAGLCNSADLRRTCCQIMWSHQGTQYRVCIGCPGSGQHV